MVPSNIFEDIPADIFDTLGTIDPYTNNSQKEFIAPPDVTPKIPPSISKPPPSITSVPNSTSGFFGVGQSASGVPNIVGMYRDVFMTDLNNLMTQIAGHPVKVPILGGNAVDLWLIFNAVMSLGGYEAVVGKKQWRVVANMAGASNIKSATGSFKRIFEVVLLEYEMLFTRVVIHEQQPPGPISVRIPNGYLAELKQFRQSNEAARKAKNNAGRRSREELLRSNSVSSLGSSQVPIGGVENAQINQPRLSNASTTPAQLQQKITDAQLVQLQRNFGTTSAPQSMMLAAKPSADTSSPLTPMNQQKPNASMTAGKKQAKAGPQTAAILPLTPPALPIYIPLTLHIPNIDVYAGRHILWHRNLDPIGQRLPKAVTEPLLNVSRLIQSLYSGLPMEVAFALNQLAFASCDDNLHFEPKEFPGLLEALLDVMYGSLETLNLPATGGQDGSLFWLDEESLLAQGSLFSSSLHTLESPEKLAGEYLVVVSRIVANMCAKSTSLDDLKWLAQHRGLDKLIGQVFAIAYSLKPLHEETESAEAVAQACKSFFTVLETLAPYIDLEVTYSCAVRWLVDVVTCSRLSSTFVVDSWIRAADPGTASGPLCVPKNAFIVALDTMNKLLATAKNRETVLCSTKVDPLVQRLCEIIARVSPKHLLAAVPRPLYRKQLTLASQRLHLVLELSQNLLCYLGKAAKRGLGSSSMVGDAQKRLNFVCQQIKSQKLSLRTLELLQVVTRVPHHGESMVHGLLALVPLTRLSVMLHWDLLLVARESLSSSGGGSSSHNSFPYSRMAVDPSNIDIETLKSTFQLNQRTLPPAISVSVSQFFNDSGFIPKIVSLAFSLFEKGFPEALKAFGEKLPSAHSSGSSNVDKISSQHVSYLLELWAEVESMLLDFLRW